MSDDHPFGGARRSRMGPAVLIAALVLAILVPFRSAIVEAVQNALSSVTSVG